MLICGIDIGKNHHEASVIDQDGRLLAKSLRFANTTPGAESLLEYIGRLPIGMVKSSVWEKDALREETRYFITSLTDVKTFAKAVRAHWGIENSLHWCLDAVFHEDACRTRKDNSAENFSVIRKIALNILKNFPAKMSLRRKRFKCEYDSDFMAQVLLSAF